MITQSIGQHGTHRVTTILGFALAISLMSPFPVLVAADKTAASQIDGRSSNATLTIVETEEMQSGEPVSKQTIEIDTGTFQYKLVYKSFKGGQAAMNGKSLNDNNSGFGMLEPNSYWYSSGFILPSIDVKGSVPHDLVNTEAKLNILESSGSRVAFDTTWIFSDATVTVRTVALADRKELFVSVLASVNSPGTVTSVTFLGYPLGFAGVGDDGQERDRWLHVEGRDIQNPSQVKLDLDMPSWIFLTDHKLNPESNAGQLGLIYDKSTIDEASVNLSSNYYIQTVFVTRDTSPEMRFILCSFEPMPWQQGRDAMGALAKEADTLMNEAFSGLPEVKRE